MKIQVFYLEIPLLAGITDALISMHSDDGNELNTYSTIEHIIEKANIEFTSMAYFRGRSLDDAFLINDKAQNMTRAQMKGMLSRGGRIVVRQCLLTLRR